MRIAIFGGSFNPVHFGHLFLAEEVRMSMEYDRIFFVPVNIPSHKIGSTLAPAEHRVAMVRRAVDQYREFVVDECEIRRGGVSFTVDTVRELMQSIPLRTRPGLVIGDDLVSEYHTWKAAADLAEMVDLIVARRTATEHSQFTYPHVYLDNLLFPISSSEIRSRLQTGRAVRFLLPDTVLDYIREHGIYC